jgi:hypothetical protein
MKNNLINTEALEEMEDEATDEEDIREETVAVTGIGKIAETKTNPEGEITTAGANEIILEAEIKKIGESSIRDKRGGTEEAKAPTTNVGKGTVSMEGPTGTQLVITEDPQAPLYLNRNLKSHRLHCQVPREELLIRQSDLTNTKPPQHSIIITASL